MGETKKNGQTWRSEKTYAEWKHRRTKRKRGKEREKDKRKHKVRDLFIEINFDAGTEGQKGDCKEIPPEIKR